VVIPEWQNRHHQESNDVVIPEWQNRHHEKSSDVVISGLQYSHVSAFPMGLPRRFTPRNDRFSPTGKTG
jgi:hypothetical protein